jgi:hypothetical protein
MYAVDISLHHVEVPFLNYRRCYRQLYTLQPCGTSIHTAKYLEAPTMHFYLLVLTATVSTVVMPVIAGPAAYAICQSACAASLTAGPGAPPAYAACQAACAALLTMPGP